jgi:hypothetical protein
MPEIYSFGLSSDRLLSGAGGGAGRTRSRDDDHGTDREAASADGSAERLHRGARLFADVRGAGGAPWPPMAGDRARARPQPGRQGAAPGGVPAAALHRSEERRPGADVLLGLSAAGVAAGVVRRLPALAGAGCRLHERLRDPDVPGAVERAAEPDAAWRSVVDLPGPRSGWGRGEDLLHLALVCPRWRLCRPGSGWAPTGASGRGAGPSSGSPWRPSRTPGER